jgi:hypothetical protein
MYIMPVCTVVITVCIVTPLRSFRPYGIMIIELYVTHAIGVATCYGNLGLMICITETSSGSGQGTVAGFCENGDEQSRSVSTELVTCLVRG